MTGFKYMGKFKGKETLPVRENPPSNAVKFKEFDDPKIMGIVLSILSAIVMIGLYFLLMAIGGIEVFVGKTFFISLLLVIVSLLPHEFLHGLCMKGQVYCYQNILQGSLFVTSTEDLSKLRFIMMSFCPNIVFGFIPFLIFLIHPAWVGFGIFGATSIASGVGDYYNIFNAITQMPKGSLTYISGFNSYWYLPEDKESNM